MNKIFMVYIAIFSFWGCTKPQKAHATHRIYELAKLKNPKSVQTIIDETRQKSPYDYLLAISALRLIHSKKALPWLFVQSQGHPDPFVKEAAQKALDDIEGKP